jgi:RNA polymerase sigma-70 factor (ECF subfamily)
VGGARQPCVRDEADEQPFDEFVDSAGRKLRAVAVAHYGLDVGEEAASDALAWAWEHWAEVRAMANPVGYLYRVVQSSARRHHRWRRPIQLPAPDATELPAIEPGLVAALARLTEDERVVVILIHALGWTYQEVGDVVGVPLSTVRGRLHRAMTRLRIMLGEKG